MSIPNHHPFAFDPTHGYGIDALRAVRAPEAISGFDAFWQARYARVRGIQPAVELGTSRFSHPAWHVSDISFVSTDAIRIGGWLLTPRDGPVERGLVAGHGYGGREAPDFEIPVERTAILFPCFRGLSRSSCARISSDPAWHVLHDIDRPDHYILGGCVEDLWLAISVLTGLYPHIEGRIGYCGTSLGGGIGALALAFDRRIDRGHLVVPTFGDMPLWLELPTVGSGNAVQNYRKTHPEVIDTMRLFDSAVAATRIGVPTLVAVARFDPAVAPPCQFSIANSLSGTSDHETIILDAGHFDYPGCEEQHVLLSKKVELFFRTK